MAVTAKHQGTKIGVIPSKITTSASTPQVLSRHVLTPARQQLLVAVLRARLMTLAARRTQF
jgi:hypothetical protein